MISNKERMRRLEAADAVRIAGKELKEEIRRGEWEGRLDSAFRDPRAVRLRVSVFVSALYTVSRTRQRAMEKAGVDGAMKVGELTSGQIADLLDAPGRRVRATSVVQRTGGVPVRKRKSRAKPKGAGDRETFVRQTKESVDGRRLREMQAQMKADALARRGGSDVGTQRSNEAVLRESPGLRRVWEGDR